MTDWAIGIDLGGTKIEAALVDSKGNIHDRQRIATESTAGYEAILAHIVNLANTICSDNQDKKPIAIGMGVAGQIEKGTGLITYSPNLNWKNVPLGSDLSKKLNLPVYICNDVRSATIGEWLFGAGKGCDDLVCIFVGTGIGSGIVTAGKVLEGANNTAGEIGHITININGPECHCGNTGCFEALAGGWAITRDLKKAVTDDPATGKTLLAIAGGDINQLSAKTLEEGRRQNDFLSTQLINNLAEYLIAGGASIVNAFGPKRFIWGGGIIEGMPELLPVIEKGIRKRALQAASNSLEIIPATLHNDSGVIGAAAYALQNLKKI